MKKEEFEPAIELVNAIAPANWASIKLTYLCDGDNMTTKGEYKLNGELEWSRINGLGFDLMDFFQDYYDNFSHTDGSKWTSITVEIDTAYNIKSEFGYGPVDVYGLKS